MIASVLFGRRVQAVFHRSLSLRFLVIGVANTFFSTALFMVLLRLGFGVVVGSALALAIGVLFSYQTQGGIVFGRKSKSAFLRFIIAWAIIYFVNLGGIRLFQYGGLNTYWAGICATIPTTVLSYFVQKMLVFRVSGGE